MKPTFFKSPAELRQWLEKHHAKSHELLVGFYKKNSGKPSITWPESVDEALCFGWIDGIRRRIDDISYTIRFTPRKSGSNWSVVNIERVQELSDSGRMQPAGLKAFQERTEDKSRIYSYEQQRTLKLDERQAKKLRANQKAWTFFQSQPRSYQRAANWWVMSAKKEETRLKRLDTLIEDSAHGRTIALLTRTKKPKR